MSLVSDCNLMSQAPTQSSAGRSQGFALITLGVQGIYTGPECAAIRMCFYLFLKKSS